MQLFKILIQGLIFIESDYDRWERYYEEWLVMAESEDAAKTKLENNSEIDEEMRDGKPTGNKNVNWKWTVIDYAYSDCFLIRKTE